MLERVRLALRITTDAFDEELTGLIDAARRDLQTSGVILPEGDDPLITQAILTYCKAYFGQPDKVEWQDRLIASYNEQKSHLTMTTGYTDWT